MSAKTPVVVRQTPNDRRRFYWQVVPSVFGSIAFHVILAGAFFLIVTLTQRGDAGPASLEVEIPSTPITADLVDDQLRSFNLIDINPLGDLKDELLGPSDRKEDFTVPGLTNPLEKPGLLDGDAKNPLASLPQTGGFGNGGVGALESLKPSTTPFAGGGTGGNLAFAVNGFPGRSRAARDYAREYGGGTTASEAAVGRGLKWLLRQQLPNGSWALNAGAESNETAATALGLLPFLAAGQTHKPGKDNPNDKRIDKALRFLMKAQDKTGYLGGGMYAHGLASIALCEAYGLTQDPVLKNYAQRALNLIVASQSDVDFGWRYGPRKEPQGDLSISGWQIMALKSGQMAGLNVPPKAIENAKKFLALSGNPDNGYAYVPGAGSTFRMTAVGLLCRQYMDNWGPSNPKMIEGIAKFIKPNTPDLQDVYYYYYATQVMHHFGGEAWRTWNEKMRNNLIRKQDSNDKNANFGSWSPEGDPYGKVGGRLMMTSLNLLTLEVYYRYLPLYYRDAGYKADPAVQK